MPSAAPLQIVVSPFTKDACCSSRNATADYADGKHITHDSCHVLAMNSKCDWTQRIQGVAFLGLAA